jgi:hypothetical protein
MVTGNCEVVELEVPASGVFAAGPVEQADRVSAAAASTAEALPAVLNRVRRVAPGPRKRGEVTKLLRSVEET